MRFGVVIPVGEGRDENLRAVLQCVARQTLKPQNVVVVADGFHSPLAYEFPWAQFVTIDKHEPGKEQPRNVGTRIAISINPDLTHVAFLDSDVIVGDDWLQAIEHGLQEGPEQRILVLPYDWMGPGARVPQPTLFNDPRWPMFHQHGAEHVYREDLSAGLACFSGNLVWPVAEFARVGGFWAEIHHGRCEDGELGLRAVAMDVPISLCSPARGWHLWHEINTPLAISRNERDVPMLNARHPWVEGADVFMVDRDGKAFDVLCSKCQRMVPTSGWWDHAPRCGVETALTVR